MRRKAALSQKVLIIGYFGSGNAGDEAILGSMLDGLRASRPDLSFVVPGEDPESIARRFGVQSFRRSDFADLLRAVDTCDAVLVGGGGLLHDIWDPQPETFLTADHWGLTYYCGIPWLAAELGKPVMLFAVGAGPLLFAEGRDLVRRLAESASVVTVRDDASARLLAELTAGTGAAPLPTADPVWTLPPPAESRRRALIAELGLEGTRWLGLALRNWDVGVSQEHWESEVLAAAEAFARAHSLGILFLPFQTAPTPLQDDAGLARRLAGKASSGTIRIAEGRTAEDLAAIISACDIVCGMRFHAVLLACAAGVPAVAIEYDPKVANLSAMIQPPLPSVAIDRMGRGNLLAALEEGWKRSGELREGERKLADAMRSRAGENTRLALELLRNPPPLRERPAARRLFDDLVRIERARLSGGQVPLVRPSFSNDRAAPGVVRIVALTFFDADGAEVYFGGAERYLLELSDLLGSMGYRIELVQRARVPWVRYYRGLRVVGVVPDSDDFNLNSVIRRTLRRRPELTIYLAFYLAGTDGPPGSLGISHGIYWDNPAFQGAPAEFERHVRRILDSIDGLERIVSVDTNTINWARANRGSLIDKFTYVPNFVDRSEFHPAPRNSPRIVVLYPRRLSAERGFWLLAEIVPRLIEERDDLDFRFAGHADPREREAVEQLSNRYPGRVVWQAILPEAMPAEYAAADIVVIPTVASEGTSLSCLEAQASGKPVIATRVGGLPDIVIDGVNGLLIEPSSAGLRAAIERLAAAPDLRASLGDNARAMSASFSIETWRDRWRNILRAHLPRRSAAASAWARRPRLTALFPAPVEPSGGGERGAVASAVARMGIDVFWVGPEDPPAGVPRLHPVALSVPLHLSRPQIFVAEPAEADEGQYPGAGVIQFGSVPGPGGGARLPPSDHPDFRAKLRALVRDALRRRRQEIEMTVPESEPAADPSSPEDRLGLLPADPRALLLEQQERIIAIRRTAAAERVEFRRIIAELDARNRGHEQEHARARAYVDELRAQQLAQQKALEKEAAVWRSIAELEQGERRRREHAEEELARARTELESIKASRVWKLGMLYWRLLSFLRPSRGLPAEPGTPLPEERPAPPLPDETPRPLPPVPAPALPEGLSPHPDGRYDVIILSIIDWDFRFQRPQQLARKFGQEGHRVFYVSTTVFLPPDGPPFELVEKAPNVVELRLRSARPLDVYGGHLSEEDVEVLEKAFSELLATAAFGDFLVKVDIPFWAPLALRLRDRFGAVVAYDCMDEWSNFPGFGPAVLQAESSLVRNAAMTIVSADRLVEKHQALARELLVVRNGVDAQHYEAFFGPNDLLGGAPRPIIGYYGALASWVDVPLLEKIARRFADGTIVLAGGRFDIDLSPIENLPNVRLLGQRPYAEMPALLWNFDVCIIPFQVNAITEATNPVKFYEYLWGEKPVVAPNLTELKPFADLCYLARDADDFVRQIERALGEGPEDPRRRRRRAAAVDNDWTARYRAIDTAVARFFPRVSVVVVTWGGHALTRACIESLRAESWPNVEVIVVDNASTDATVPYLERVAAEDPRIRLILNSTNRGFAAANNAGARIATGEIIVLLNNDTVVPPGLLGRLTRRLIRDPGIGVLCPTTNFAGNEAKVDPDYSDISGLPAAAARRARDHAGSAFPIEVAAMYCIAMRREVLAAVGPLDEAYGVGMFEDDDFSLRVRQAGFSVLCAEDAYVHHVGQGSFRKLSPSQYQELWDRNKAYFEKKWGVTWRPHQPRAGTIASASKIGT
jgi:polysaccharide pyruvyl transferase CsaB